MTEPFVAEIKMFGGNFAPVNYAFCDGQLMPISQNSALFSLLGTTYGGNGISTFALPDLRGRVPMHPGNGPGLSPRVLGESDGSETVTLLSNNVPSHTHTASSTATSVMRANNTATDNALDPTGRGLGIADRDVYVNAAPNVDMIAGSVNTTVNTTISPNTGGNAPVSIMQPFLCVSFIIALNGIFPSRS